VKLNELISHFTIAVSNEESQVLDKIDSVMLYDSFTERDQFVIDGLIRKSLVTKIKHKGNFLVTKNEI